jgi:tRNA (cytidine/uridine-2'-O-)-methyltransferase
MFNIVLVEPEIPQNSGNIIRLSACSGCRLYLVEPLGFSLDNSRLKRAGLDYWEKTVFSVVPSLETLLDKYGEERFFYLSTKGTKPYTEHEYRSGDFLVFGKETAGLNEDLLKVYAPQVLTIPMPGKTRSMNLANSVAITVYEGLRQLNVW